MEIVGSDPSPAPGAGCHRDPWDASEGQHHHLPGAHPPQGTRPSCPRSRRPTLDTDTDPSSLVPTPATLVPTAFWDMYIIPGSSLWPAATVTLWFWGPAALAGAPSTLNSPPRVDRMGWCIVCSPRSRHSHPNVPGAFSQQSGACDPGRARGPTLHFLGHTEAPEAPRTCITDSVTGRGSQKQAL